MDNERKRHSHEYQDLFNNIPGGAFLCTQDDHCIMTEISRGFLELTGFGREELEEQFGCSFAAMLHPADQKDVMERMLSLAEDKDKAFVNCRIRCKDGSYKWAADSVRLVRKSAGGNQLFCIMLDVTESGNAGEELRLSLERHKIIMDQTTDIIFEWDICADTLIFSSNWAKTVSYTHLTLPTT